MDIAVLKEFVLPVVVVVVAAISPVIMATIQNRSSRKMKEQDWERQDQVAAKAEEAAKLLLAEQKKTSDRTAEVAIRLDKTSSDTNNKLDEVSATTKIIHALVNSTLTKSMQAELEGARRELVSLEEIIELKRERGLQPSVAAQTAIEATKAKINELSATVHDRARQQATIDEGEKKT